MEVVDVIKKCLHELGVESGNTLMVHTSLKSLGGGVSPAELVDALISAVGEEGTLVMPSVSHLVCNKNNPVFDYYKTPSNVGVTPEYFRSEKEGVIRSLSPTHSCCAFGAQANYITSGHIKDIAPCGENSPFRRVWELGGKILFLGCGMLPNTSMHAVEELYEPDYLFEDTYEYRMIDKTGNSFLHLCRAHDFSGVAQRYDRLEGMLTPNNEIKTGYVLRAFCHLIDVKAMWEKAGNAFAENPYYFVDIV